jgi:hypothetical protein
VDGRPAFEPGFWDTIAISTGLPGVSRVSVIFSGIAIIVFLLFSIKGYFYGGEGL